MPARWSLVLAAVLIVLCPLSAAATDVPPGPVSGIWGQAGSPYNILGDITVPAGQTLTIEPGVEVLFQGAYRLTAMGTMSAVGTVADSIHFDGSVTWEQIRLESETGPSIFSYCRIAGAETGLNSIDSPVDVSNCHFHDHVTAINVYGIGSVVPATVNITNCRIQACQNHGIFIVENSNTTIEGCEITRCALSGSPRGAIQLSNQTSSGHNDPTITGNWIHHNVWQGLTAFDITGGGRIDPLITSNTIEYNLTGIYLLHACGRLEFNEINHNFEAGNPNSGAGVMVSGASAQPVLVGNTITGNFTALYVVDGAMPNLGDLNNASADDDGWNNMHDNVDPGGNTWSVYSNSTANIMAENNYWGSNNMAEIAETIYDGIDNPAYGIVDFDPLMVICAVDEATPAGARPAAGLLGNHPNPFNPHTTIWFNLGETTNAERAIMGIYNVAGRLVRRLVDDRLAPGIHGVEWNGTDEQGREAPSGSYYCRLTIGTRVYRQQLVLLR